MSRALVALAATLTFGNLLVAAPATAGAAANSVVISGFAFDPVKLPVSQGATVTWTNQDPAVHTATSDVGLFDTGDIAASGGTSAVTFDSAGRFRYHCMHHTFMQGSIVVRISLAGGSAADGWKLRWATQAAPDGVAYDVQFKRVNATDWRDLRKDTTHASGKLNPSTAGKYVVRARTTNTVDDAESGWSPLLALRIS